jgi:hypothetical protein
VPVKLLLNTPAQDLLLSARLVMLKCLSLAVALAVVAELVAVQVLHPVAVERLAELLLAQPIFSLPEL